MHPSTMGALFLFTFSRNEDIYHQTRILEFFLMEDWQDCVIPFIEGNVEELRMRLTAVIQSNPGESAPVMDLVSKAVDDLVATYLESALGYNSDLESKSRSEEILTKMMHQIPQNLLLSDTRIAKVLLIPVLRLVEREFANAETVSKRRHFYEDTQILSLWYRMPPEIWCAVSEAYSIEREMSEAIIDEIETIRLGADVGSLPIRSRLNGYIQTLKHKRPTIETLTRVCGSGLENLYELIDLEIFMDVFPDEVHFTSTDVQYTLSFARKLALTAVKQWVHAHQMHKKDRQCPFPKKDKVIRACIQSHLDITDERADRDCQYFFSHLRKDWLRQLLKDPSFHIFELFDHIRDDPSLVNQMLCFLEDSLNTERGACLLTLSEDLRCERRRKGFLDDNLTQVLMSYMQTGRTEHWTAHFGPYREGAFVLPFTINHSFMGETPINADCYEVLVIDKLDQLNRLSAYIESGHAPVVHIDVFYKVFSSWSLERPRPNVVTLGTHNKVFIVMVGRMELTKEGILTKKLRDFFTKLFTNTSILKLMNGTRQSEKSFLLWSLITSDPFSPPDAFQPNLVEPLSDICFLYPSHSFGNLVNKLLGGLLFCDYEETSDWSRPYLRESQLHFVASRSWLSVQLFHTIKESQAAQVHDTLFSIDFRYIFGGSGYFSPWTGGSLDCVSAWLSDNPAHLVEAQEIVTSSQEELHAERYRELYDESESDADDSDLADIDWCKQTEVGGGFPLASLGL